MLSWYCVVTSALVASSALGQEDNEILGTLIIRSGNTGARRSTICSTVRRWIPPETLSSALSSTGPPSPARSPRGGRCCSRSFEANLTASKGQGLFAGRMAPWSARCHFTPGLNGTPSQLKPGNLGQNGLNAHESAYGHWPFVVQRMQSPLSEFVFGNVFAFFSFAFHFAGSSLLQVCPRLGFALWNENQGFDAQDVFGPSTSVCNNRISGRQMQSLERGLATNISILPTFQFASCTGFPT